MTTADKSRSKLRLVMEGLLSCAFMEDEEAQLIRMGRAACADPSWTDYLYWPDRYGLDGSIEAAPIRRLPISRSASKSPKLP